jgi:uncharacterized membrane protein (UPF0127 family)
METKILQLYHNSQNEKCPLGNILNYMPAVLHNNAFTKFIGLMFKFKPIREAHIFDFNFESKLGSSIHTFFMFQNIDIIFLNSKLEVVDIVYKATPFKFYISKKTARYVIELPSDKTDATLINGIFYFCFEDVEIKIGDKMRW